MKLVRKLIFFNEYGELETVKPVYRVVVSAVEAVGESVAVVV